MNEEKDIITTLHEVYLKNFELAKECLLNGRDDYVLRVLEVGIEYAKEGIALESKLGPYKEN